MSNATISSEELQTKSGDDRRIRELDDAEFSARYDCDRFSASILLNRLRYAVEHMSTGLLQQAFSPIIRDYYDFACTISGPPEFDYSQPVVSNALVGFIGTMPDAVANMVAEFGPENLTPGDVLICNDPYRVATHVNDMCFTRPVFLGDRIIAFINLRAHQLDMGGSVPGGFSGTMTSVYEAGLAISPTLLWHAEEPVESTFNLIWDNTRFPQLLVPDFWSIYQQLKLGERLLLENVEKYGLDAVHGTFRYSCDVSAELMRDAIRAIPDGDYRGTSVMDADGVDDSVEFTVCVTIRKHGDNIEADFSGTSAQARSSINGTILEAKTAVGAALTMLLDPSIPLTSGTWRNIDIAIPPGSLLSALPPTGPTLLYFEAMSTALTAVLSAMNPILGENGIGGDYGSNSVHNGWGTRDDGTAWTNGAQLGGEHGPWGATKVGDADSYVAAYKDNGLEPSAEQIEHDTPCVVLRKEFAADTGGPGYNRGGAATRKDSVFLTAASHYSSPFRLKRPTGVGANGGRSGAVGAVWIFPPKDGERQPVHLVGESQDVYADSIPVAGVLDPEGKFLDAENGTYSYFASSPVWVTEAGSVFRYQTNGGGGWGDPYAREPDRVLADVRNEYVSVEGAARNFGVVISGDPQLDPEGLRIDDKATAELRSSRGNPG